MKDCCKGCPLNDQEGLRGRALGNQSKILFVKDAPSIQDSFAKTLFKDEASARLYDLCNKCLFDTKLLFLTSLVKCLPKVPPPKNKRPPTEIEINHCKSILETEIKNIKPVLIVPIGKVACQFFTGRTDISQVHGRIFTNKDYNCEVIPLLDPAAIERRPKTADKIYEDLLKIKKRLTPNEQRKNVNYILVDSIDKFKIIIETLNKASEIAFDLETTGFNWWKDDKIIGISLCCKEKEAYYIPWCYYEAFNWGHDWSIVKQNIKDLLESPIPKIAHNGKFDIKFLKVEGIQVNNFNVDTLLLHYMLNEERGTHDLKKCTSQFIPDMAGYEEELQAFVKGIPRKDRNYGTLRLDVLYWYAAADADCTFRLKHIFVDMLEQEENRLQKLYGRGGIKKLFFDLVMPLQEALCETEFIGVKVDLAYIKKLTVKYKDKLLQLENSINKKFGDFNIKSPKQLGYKLFTELKLPVLKTTGINICSDPNCSGQGKNKVICPKCKKSMIPRPSTDEEVLKELAKKTQHELPILLLQYRADAKILSTYLEGLQPLIDKNDRVHTTYLVAGTTTGRLSSREPNLQNQPKTEEMRNIFIASPGYKLLCCDYSAAELRVLANYTGDETLIDTFRQNKDIHRIVAANTFNIPEEKVSAKLRTAIKTIEFGIIYGRGPVSVAEQLGIPVEEAQEYINRYFARYPKISNWITNIKKCARTYKEVVSLFGRVRRFLDIEERIKKGDKKKVALYEREAVNSPIQGGASDILSLATGRIFKEFKKRQLDARIVLTVHDEVVIEYKEEIEQEVIQIVEIIAECPLKCLVLPPKMDIESVSRWGEAVEGKGIKEEEKSEKN